MDEGVRVAGDRRHPSARRGVIPLCDEDLGITEWSLRFLYRECDDLAHRRLRGW
jgi:hypothetical protein